MLLNYSQLEIAKILSGKIGMIFGEIDPQIYKFSVSLKFLKD